MAKRYLKIAFKSSVILTSLYSFSQINRFMVNNLDIISCYAYQYEDEKDYTVIITVRSLVGGQRDIYLNDCLLTKHVNHVNHAQT